ncbi:hypothetical protein NON00_24255, partial [Roseomonas sp. GC11]|uniref:hypothetical protein n=1 Tax=Roseomonas sp. GC11 TaxID=2950546 RepID=UPI00210A00F9
AALCAALPALSARFGAAEAEAFAAALLPALREEPAVAVQVAPALVETVAARFATLAPGLPPVTVSAAPELEPGDAVLRWQGGEAARHGAAGRAAIARALAACGLLPPPAPAPQGTAAEATAPQE